jgi:hypothetical protein
VEGLEGLLSHKTPWYVFKNIKIFMYIYLYACIYIYLYKYIYVFTYVYTYIYIYSLGDFLRVYIEDVDATQTW